MDGGEQDQLSQLSATKKGNLLMVVSMKARQFAFQFKSDLSGVASNSQEVTAAVRCMMNHGLGRPCRGYF